MVAIIDKCGLQEVWVKEAQTTPSFEEILRLLAMYEFPNYNTTIWPVDVEATFAGEIPIGLGRGFMAVGKVMWRDESSGLLCDAAYADWKDAKLIVVLTK